MLKNFTKESTAQYDGIHRPKNILMLMGSFTMLLIILIGLIIITGPR